MAANTNLTALPNDISIDYFTDVKISDHAKERGYNFFVNGYIHGLKLSISMEFCIDIAAKCYRSMRKNEQPHKISLTVNVHEKRIVERHCSCKAGINGTCSHTVGAIFTLAHYKNLGLRDVPSELACTSMPQQWHKPRGPKIHPEPVSSMVFAKPRQTPRKKRPVHSTTPNVNIPDIKAEDIKKLKTDPRSVGTPLEYLLQDELELTETTLGAVQLGSMLPFQLKNYKPIINVNQGPCGNITFPQTTFIEEDICLKYNHLNKVFNTTQDDAEKIEQLTIQQSKNAMWFEERSKRVTASQFAKICKRVKDITPKFVDSIFNIKCFQSEATSYGKCHESTAKQAYIEKNPNNHIHDCGLVINPKYSFLAASPDGKICVDGETGVLEIKCPFSARDCTVPEAVETIPNFCLQKSGHTFALKRNHDYFYQVQGQLMVTGVFFCIFVIYTKKDLFVERIECDKHFTTEMFEKLATFYQQHHA